ncbi:MAG TPA: Xaa-Pro peptidase family protein [Acidobacteriaceae bacterium]|jgi:Xaa-Pro dipeptidase|nr:Xaa-Pro peptidase family protein [Acidobacteriaceae bacterium]
MPTRRRFLLSAAAAPSLSLLAQRPQSAASAAGPTTTGEEALPAPLLGLADRRKEIVPITVEERNARLERARELMKANRIEAIAITTGSSLLYYTGARWGQSERLFAYVIPRTGAPFLVAPSFERDRVAELMPGFPAGETARSYFWQENEDPYALVRKGLAECSVRTGTVGIEEHTQFAFSHGIAKACPGLTIASATPVTAGCRAIKSAAELACLRLANEITLSVYRAVYLSCGPGDTNHRFVELVNRGYERCGVQGEASCNVGTNSGVPHGSRQPQVIREHEVVLIDDGCTVEGYTSDISRSFVYGTATDLQRSVFDVVHKAQAAALAAAKPGVEMQAVDAAARKVIVDAGYGPGFEYFTHRVGHGIGLDMHEWPYLVPGNTQKLAAGMVFSDEPGVYMRGKFGIRLEDDMHITEDGAKLFTPQSPSLRAPFAIPEFPGAAAARPGR